MQAPLKQKILKSCLLILAIFAAFLLWQGLKWQYFLQKPLNVTGKGLEYTLQPGETLRSFADELAEQGVLSRPRLLRILARLKGLDTHIQAGEYYFPAGTQPGQMLEQLADGKVIQYNFTIIEGWTFKELREALAAHPVLQPTLDKDMAPSDVMAALGKAGEHPEGRFLPNTYFFPRGTEDIKVLARSYQAMEDYVAARWPHRTPDLPYETPYEMLTMASIVEREAKLPEERPKVAGVLTKRLRIGMGLQADATVIYALGSHYTGVLTRSNLQHKSPYNTYEYAGLPPTPIAMPGIAAIEAVLQPEIGAALYYVVDDPDVGSHVFSATLQEHNEAATRYRSR